MTSYTIRTRTDVVGTLTSWEDAVAFARGYWGMTPSIRAAEDASTYTITVFGDYVGDMIVESDDVDAELAAELLRNESRAAGRRVERDWSTLATGGTFVSGAAL